MEPTLETLSKDQSTLTLITTPPSITIDTVSSQPTINETDVADVNASIPNISHKVPLCRNSSQTTLQSSQSKIDSKFFFNCYRRPSVLQEKFVRQNKSSSLPIKFLVAKRRINTSVIPVSLPTTTELSSTLHTNDYRIIDLFVIFLDNEKLKSLIEQHCRNIEFIETTHIDIEHSSSKFVHYVIYKGKYNEIDVTVKVIRKIDAIKHNICNQIITEIVALYKLANNPHIVKLYGIVLTDDAICIVTEYSESSLHP